VRVAAGAFHLPPEVFTIWPERGFSVQGIAMHDPDINSLMKAASERQLAVAALQKKYEESESVPTEQLVKDMRELLATERVVLDAIITLFVKMGHVEEERTG
jgi:hypothetical protein